jgi:hypothetical protein
VAARRLLAQQHLRIRVKSCLSVMKRRDFFKHTLAGATLTAVGASVRGILVAGLEPKELLSLAGTKSFSPGSFTRMFPRLPRQGAGNPRIAAEISKNARDSFHIRKRMI